MTRTPCAHRLLIHHLSDHVHSIDILKKRKDPALKAVPSRYEDEVDYAALRHVNGLVLFLSEGSVKYPQIQAVLRCAHRYLIQK